MSNFVLLRGLFVLGINILGHQFWPMLTDFTARLAVLDTKLLGFISMTLLDTQLCQGAIFLFVCGWLFVYTQGYVEELEIIRCGSVSEAIICGCKWLIAMIIFFVLIVAEPLVIHLTLQDSALPRWLIYAVGLLLWWIALWLGWDYPNRVLNRLRRTIGMGGRGHE